MGDTIIEKITKRSCYQAISIFIFFSAILTGINNRMICGYTLIILGYYILRKSDLEE